MSGTAADAPSSRACARCEGDVVVDGRNPPWCGACGWGLRPPAPPAPRGRLERPARRQAARVDDATVERLIAAETLTPRWDARRTATVVIAVLVLMLAVAFVAVAVLLVTSAGANPFADVLAVVLLLLAVAMRPRLGRLDGDGVALARDDAPALYALVDEVAAALAARGPDVIVLDAAFNASWSVVGVRRRRVLTLGLPLVAVLEPQELVALIGHEVGHERNGDLTHLWIVDSSLHGLGAIADALTPHPGEGRYEFGPLASIVNALMLVLGLPARGLLRAQLALVLRDSRRAEYLADHLAAQVAGSDAEISGEEKFLLAGVLDATLQRHDFGPRVDGREAIALLRSAVRDVPERERERRRRVARMEGVRAGATHPPTGRRIEVVQRRPPQRAAIVLDGARAAAVARELSAHEGELGRELVERWRDGWRLAA